MGATSVFFILAGLPQRAPFLGPSWLVPEAQSLAAGLAGHSSLLPSTVMGPAPQAHPGSPALPEMQRLAPID